MDAHSETYAHADLVVSHLHSNLPGYIRKILDVSEGFEASPCSQHDAERSITALLVSRPASRPLLIDEIGTFRTPAARFGYASEVLRIIREQLEHLERGAEIKSPRELIDAFEQSRNAAIKLSGGVPDLPAHAADLLSFARQLGSRFHNLYETIFKTRREVQEIESLALLEMSPDDSRAHLRLGEALASEGKFEKALVHFRAAYDLDPECPDYVYFLARCLHDLGRSLEAKPIALRAAALQSDFCLPQYLLGQVFEALGEKQAAVEAYLLAQEFHAGTDGMLEVNRDLQRLACDLSLTLPRPPNFCVPDVDERHWYRSMGMDCNFRLRIFKKAAGAIFLVTRDHEAVGASFSEEASALSRQICEKHGIPPVGLTWVEDVEKSLFGGFSLMRAEKLQSREITWKAMSHGEFEALTGYRLTWSLTNGLR